MKNFFTISSLLLLAFFGCQDNKKNKNLSIDKNIENINANEDEVEKEIKKINSDSIIELAQGIWKRTDYPYGTIEFNNMEIKTTPGEGVAEEPVFEAFQLTDYCPEKQNETLNNNQFYINVADRCVKYEIKNDTLKYLGLQRDFEIVYTKVKG